MLDQQVMRQYFSWQVNAVVPPPNVSPIDKASPSASATESFLENELDLNAPEVSGLLVQACIRGDAQAVQALLSQGEDVNASDQQGLTALDHALLTHKTEI